MGTVRTVDLVGTLLGIDGAGRTRFIICFALDENDDAGNNWAGICSANHGTGSRHPRWIVTYMNVSHRWPKPRTSTLPLPMVCEKRGVMKFGALGANWVLNTGFRVMTDLLNH
jgi:hypothetical protein